MLPADLTAATTKRPLRALKYTSADRAAIGEPPAPMAKTVMPLGDEHGALSFVAIVCPTPDGPSRRLLATRWRRVAMTTSSQALARAVFTRPSSCSLMLPTVRHNHLVSVEQLAVNAVSDRIALCPRLHPEISQGDRTPITDGHIDFYSGKKHSKKTLEGRVPVQVKGRVTKARIKASRPHHSFSVEREVLTFFREHGGGVYFYVPMRENGSQREVFYAILLPFKIDHLLAGGDETQKTFTVKLTRLPKAAAQVDGIIRLAWNGRIQSAARGGNGHLMEQAESLRIHSLAGFDETRPTRLSLSETDYVVVAQLQDGVEVAVDVDLELLPPDYIERDLAVAISCGGVEFTRGTGRRLDESTHLLHLSAGLDLRLRVEEHSVRSTLHLTREGTFREQAKNFDFMLAAANGSPLLIGHFSGGGSDPDPEFAAQLQRNRSELDRLIELLDELEVDDARTSTIPVDDKTRKLLLALHEGICQDKPVRGSSDGTGRYDVAVGAHKIMVIVMPAEDDSHRRVIDPFDPSKRERFRIYRIDESGSPQRVDSGTVYESIEPADMASLLNLRLGGIVDTYAALEDRADALIKANLTVLRLLSAADLAADEEQRAYLVGGAAELCTWLMGEQSDSLIHQVNWWQIQYRLGALDDDDRRRIRLARRSIDRANEQAGLLEACLLILLEDDEELQLVLAELHADALETLHSWPVWALQQRGASPGPTET